MRNKSQRKTGTPARNIHIGDLLTLPGILGEMSTVYREMRLRLTPEQECRGLIWALGQLRMVCEAKLHFEAQGLNTERGSAVVPVALRRFFEPIEPRTPGRPPRPPQPDSVKVQGSETKQ